MLNFILWLILIYILFRVIGKYLLPFLLKYYVKRFQRKFYHPPPHTDPNRKEWDTNVEFTSDDKTKKSKNIENIGEYIDYEEIDTK